MLEKLNVKTIVSKIVAYLFLIFFIFILPPPSISFLILSLSVVILTLLLMVVSLKKRNAKLYLIYHIGTFTIFFILGLRFWDISIGTSFKMLICLIPGLSLASFLPFINPSLSERLYAAQWLSGAKNLLLLATLGLANIIIVTILWQLIGVVEVKNIPLMPFGILGFLFYVIQLMGMQSGIHSYVNGFLQNWLNSKNGQAVR
ncbi:MAG: hypothetical protein U0Z26_04650 [Anaerolineales bacterium]